MTICCVFVSATVTSAFVNAGVTNELSTFPLRFRDMRLVPITPSTFLQAFAPPPRNPHPHIACFVVGSPLQWKIVARPLLFA